MTSTLIWSVLITFVLVTLYVLFQLIDWPVPLHHIHIQYFLSSRYYFTLFPAPCTFLADMLSKSLSSLTIASYIYLVNEHVVNSIKAEYKENHELNDEAWFVARASLDLCFSTSLPSMAAPSSTTSWAVKFLQHISQPTNGVFSFYVPKSLIKIVVKVARAILFQWTV